MREMTSSLLGPARARRGRDAVGGRVRADPAPRRRWTCDRHAAARRRCSPPSASPSACWRCRCCSTAGRSTGSRRARAPTAAGARRSLLRRLVERLAARLGPRLAPGDPRLAARGDRAPARPRRAPRRHDRAALHRAQGRAGADLLGGLLRLPGAGRRLAADRVRRRAASAGSGPTSCSRAPAACARSGSSATCRTSSTSSPSPCAPASATARRCSAWRSRSAARSGEEMLTALRQMELGASAPRRVPGAARRATTPSTLSTLRRRPAAGRGARRAAVRGAQRHRADMRRAAAQDGAPPRRARRPAGLA